MTDTPATPDPEALAGPDVVAPAEPSPFPWWLVLLLGGTSVLFGTAVLANPGGSLRALSVLVGLWLLVSGIVRVVVAFVPGRGLGRQILSGLVGLLFVVAGVACLRDLVKALGLLALMVALGWLFSGLTAIVMSVEAQGLPRFLLVAIGAFAMVLGFILLVSPGASLAAVVLLTGISAVLVGGVEVVGAFVLRRTRR